MIYWNDNFYDTTLELAEDWLERDNEEMIKFFEEKPEDWFEEAEECRLETIFDFENDDMYRLVDEDRFSEGGYEKEVRQITKAFTESLDLDKLNLLLPKLWYPHKKIKLTKEDFLVNIR